MNPRWLQQLSESYRKLLKESEQPSRYWSSSHNWEEISEPEEFEYGSDRFYGDGLQQSQNSGRPTGYHVHRHSGQVVSDYTLKDLAKREVHAFHKAGHDFENAEHGYEEHDAPLAKELSHVVDTEDTPEVFTEPRMKGSMTGQVDAAVDAMRKRKYGSPTGEADPHVRHFRSLKAEQK